MTSTTKEIVHQVQNEFDDLLNFVLKDTCNSQAHEVERGIWGRLLQIGYLLMQTFFQVRCAQYGREPLVTDAGISIPYIEERERVFFSIFGKMKIPRPYFYQRKQGGFSPLDELLGLGKDSYSEMLREMHEELSVHMAYGRVVKIMNRFLSIELSTRVTQQLVTEDATDVVTFYEKKETPTVESEAEILVIQADGKGVPLIMTESTKQRQTRKKESVVTSIYTIAPNPRTPDEFLTAFFDQVPPTGKRHRPQKKQVWATLKGKDKAFQRLYQQVHKREGEHIQHRVALCDGDDALQSRLQTGFPPFSLILDFIHATEYLWEAAHTLFADDDPALIAWVKTHTRQMLSSQTATLISDLRQQAKGADATSSQQQSLTKAANYFERNTPFMDYKTYLACGWPIASGVIEGACRHLVKDRMELSGMRWLQPTAEALLHLRAVAENDDWDDYHHFRRKCRLRRLYHPVPSDISMPITYHQLPLAF